MARCIDCKSFPWKRDSDFSMLPDMRCSEELDFRRWTKETATIEHNCQYFNPKKEEEILAEESIQDPDEEIVELHEFNVRSCHGELEEETQELDQGELEELKKVVEEDDTDTDTENKTKKITRRESSRRRK